MWLLSDILFPNKVIPYFRMETGLPALTAFALSVRFDLNPYSYLSYMH